MGHTPDMTDDGPIRRIVPGRGAGDLPEPVRAALRELAAVPRGRALFSGPSGTGKTLAAEVLAAERGVEVLAIDLSQVVNKYIGETEKNLRRAFDAASASGAVLLMEDVDALFGRRTAPKHANDRYADVDVGFLIGLLERFDGWAVLTATHRVGVDAALLGIVDRVLELSPGERP